MELSDPEYAQFKIMRRRILTTSGTTLLTVPNGSGTITFTFPRKEVDTNYIVSALPEWNTSVWVSNKTTTNCVFNFSAAPGSDSVLHVQIMRSE